MSDDRPALTIGISTKNRPVELVRCLESLRLLQGLRVDLVIVDNASDVPVSKQLEGKLSADYPIELRLVRNDWDKGLAYNRNYIVENARADYVLNLDDDAFVLDERSILEAMAVLDRDPTVAIVALRQTAADGVPHPAFMQPAPVEHPCIVASFIGYGHLIRRDVFLALGGYRVIFELYGEEIELSKRILDAGHKVVYLPDARVAHTCSPVGRPGLRYMGYMVRNGCFDALYNEPAARAVYSIPGRLARYVVQMRRHELRTKAGDPGGFQWIVRELVQKGPEVLRDRKPLRPETFRRWAEIRRVWPRYESPRTEAARKSTAEATR